MRGDELANGRFQLGDAAVDTTAQLFVGELGKPTLHEVEPRAVGRGEVGMKARPLREPVSDEWRLVRAVVIHDQMHVEMAWHGGVDRVEELPELCRPMPLMKLRDQLSGLHVERREQRRRTLP